MRSTTLVVLEPRSDWPVFLAYENVDLIALGSGYGGSPEALVRHAGERAASSGKRIRRAVLACNDDAGEQAIGLRADIASALLDCVQAVPGGELILVGPRFVSHALRRELMEQVASLTRASRSPGLRITLRMRNLEAVSSGTEDGERPDATA